MTVTRTYTFTNVRANHTISASVVPVVSYGITASHDSHSTISPDGVTEVASGTTQIISYTALSGYSVTNVVVDGSSVTITGSYTFSNVTAPHTISVTTTLDTVTITSQSDVHSTITPSGVTTLNVGDNQDFIYQALTGYQIQQVLVDGQPQQITGHYAFNAVNANHNITVTTNAYAPVSLRGSSLIGIAINKIESLPNDNIFNSDVANPGVGDFCLNFRKVIAKAELRAYDNIWQPGMWENGMFDEAVMFRVKALGKIQQ